MKKKICFNILIKYNKKKKKKFVLQILKTSYFEESETTGDDK